ncbi:MAG: hypothetical protein IPM48_03975 [Saprospiraceae bacterium]|nr:hypothetical protein [Saprospiraceae bacterium]
MKTHSLLLFSLIAFGIGTISAFSQNCDLYIPHEEGAKWEISNYNDKSKSTGKMAYEIMDVEETDQGLNWTIKTISFNAKNQEQSKNNLVFKCANGIFYFDMKSLMTPENSAFAKADMELSFEGEDLQMPANITIGQSLPDARLKLKVMSGSMILMTSEVRMLNRKILSNEKITTPAGTFDCFKMSYDSEVNSILSFKSTNTIWYAKNVGMVKSESYDKKGNLKAWSELSLLKT